MSRHTPRHGGQHPPPLEAAGEVVYAEDRSAVSRWLIVPSIAMPVLCVGLSLLWAVLGDSTVTGSVMASLVVTTGMWGASSLLTLRFTWPIGIRADTAAIRIGGLRARERRQRSGRWPPRRPFHSRTQGRAVFSCAWEGVRALYLVRSRVELKPLIQQHRAFRKRCKQLYTPLGVLGVGDAVLVIVTDLALARSDPGKFRPDRVSAVPSFGVMSPTWVVPTRHPDALRAALARVPGAPPVHDGLPAGQQFWFSEIEAARAALQAWQAQHPPPPPQPGT